MDDQLMKTNDVELEFKDISEDDIDDSSSETKLLADEVEPSKEKAIDYFINEQIWDKIGKY